MKIKLSGHAKYLRKRNALLLLIAGSIASVALTPFTAVKQDVIANLPWVGFGMLTTEILFILGIGIMALEAGHELGRNPLLWRRRLHHMISNIVSTRMFWLGFWVNAIGAVGTAVIVGTGIIRVLPPQNWILLWLPLTDLGFTIAIRAAAIVAIEEAK